MEQSFKIMANKLGKKISEIRKKKNKSLEKLSYENDIPKSTWSRVENGEVINIGKGSNISVNELARMIGGPTVPIEPRIEPRETLADNSLAKELLGWEPKIDLPEWLNEYKKEMGLIK